MDGVEYDAFSVIYQKPCKGTTKNEHLQQNRAKVYFQVRFCYKWAALCDCTFEVVEYPKDTRLVSSKVQLVT